MEKILRKYNIRMCEKDNIKYINVADVGIALGITPTKISNADLVYEISLV